MATGHYLPPLIFGALAKVLPDQVMAAAGSPLWSIIQTGVDAAGRTYANTLFFNGGTGATAKVDGQNCFSWPSNISNVPVELVERNTPLFVGRKSLRDGSGGPGRRRGGLGQEIEITVESDTPVGIIFMAERLAHPAEGLNGGAPGTLGEVLVDGVPTDVRADHVLTKGQTITLRTPGGGGFGDPAERETERGDADRRGGYG
jgi:N-methylhydantoinase B